MWRRNTLTWNQMKDHSLLVSHPTHNTPTPPNHHPPHLSDLLSVNMSELNTTGFNAGTWKYAIQTLLRTQSNVSKCLVLSCCLLKQNYSCDHSHIIITINIMNYQFYIGVNIKISFN